MNDQQAGAGDANDLDERYPLGVGLMFNSAIIEDTRMRRMMCITVYRRTPDGTWKAMEAMREIPFTAKASTSLAQIMDKLSEELHRL